MIYYLAMLRLADSANITDEPLAFSDYSPNAACTTRRLEVVSNGQASRTVSCASPAMAPASNCTSPAGGLNVDVRHRSARKMSPSVRLEVAL
jgi:hypothetical protein